MVEGCGSTLKGVVRTGGLVLVRVQLQRQLAVAALQVVLAAALDAPQHLVVVLLDQDLANQLALLRCAGVLRRYNPRSTRGQSLFVGNPATRAQAACAAVVICHLN